MCGVCGCGGAEHPAGDHEHVAADGTRYRHSHGSHDHPHAAPRIEARRAGIDVPGVSQARLIRIEQDILGRNDAIARTNRARLDAAGSFAVNLMSSPGSGKTTLLTRTLQALLGNFELAVIEGDQQTSLDAERIRRAGAPALQVNTGKGCHLDASMIARALDELPPPNGMLFIENVGNLVCPAGFDLGEHRRAIVVSVTEGEDKPLKYPDMFARADVVVVNKVDLLPHLSFDIAALEANLRKLKPDVPILRVSSTTGEGLEAWIGWLEAGLEAVQHEARK